MPKREQQASLIVGAIGGNGADRRRLLEQKVVSARYAQPVYALAFERWSAMTASARIMDLVVNGRMVTGLGEASVLEVGVTIHRTYQTPFIRGSALKGLAAHYCARVLGRGESAAEFRPGGRTYEVLFGSTDSAGFVTFHDAWIHPVSLSGDRTGFVLDVMTPHHGPYYMTEGEIAPTDFDDPNPVAFLSIAGKFRFAVDCTDSTAEGQRWGEFAFQLLRKALIDWGVGAKTNSGYGRFE